MLLPATGNGKDRRTWFETSSRTAIKGLEHGAKVKTKTMFDKTKAMFVKTKAMFDKTKPLFYVFLFIFSSIRTL